MPLQKRTIFLGLFLLVLLLFVLPERFFSFLTAPTTTEEQTEEQRYCFGNFSEKGNEASPVQIVGLGDSLTAGIGDEKEAGGYLGSLKRQLAEEDCFVTIKNYSKSGYKSTDLLNTLKEDDVVSAIREADMVVFTIGANDLVSLIKKHKIQINQEVVETAQKQYAKHIESILQEIRQINPKVKIYAIGFYNPFAQIFASQEEVHALISRWNEQTKEEVTKAEDAFFIPIDQVFAQRLEELLADDLFHPNYQGYETIANQIIRHLKK